MSEIAHGFSVIMGAGSEATFADPVAATEKVCFISETLSEMVQEVMDASICGNAAQSIGQPGTKIIEGGVVYPWRTDVGSILLKRFFGDYQEDTPEAGQNTYVLTNSIDQIGTTIAIDKQVKVYEFAGFKGSNFKLTGSPGDGIRISLDGFAVLLDTESILNTSETLEALDEEGFILLFQDAVLRIADLDDALAGGDALDVSVFSVEMNRNLDAVEVNSHNRTEALENNFRESRFTFTVPQYSSDFVVDAHRAHTPLQADITITSGAFVKIIQMPKLIVLEYKNNVGGPGFLQIAVTCQVIPDPEGTNAFMTMENIRAELQILEIVP